METQLFISRWQNFNLRSRCAIVGPTLVNKHYWFWLWSCIFIFIFSRSLVLAFRFLFFFFSFWTRIRGWLLWWACWVGPSFQKRIRFFFFLARHRIPSVRAEPDQLMATYFSGLLNTLHSLIVSCLWWRVN